MDKIEMRKFYINKDRGPYSGNSELGGQEYSEVLSYLQDSTLDRGCRELKRFIENRTKMNVRFHIESNISFDIDICYLVISIYDWKLSKSDTRRLPLRYDKEFENSGRNFNTCDLFDLFDNIVEVTEVRNLYDRMKIAKKILEINKK